MDLDFTFVGLLTVFAAGAISFLSPCVLPLVPGYISFVTGGARMEPAVQNRLRANWQALVNSLYFVLGFTTIFVLLGATATALGALFRSYLYEANLIGGAVVIIFGVVTTGLVPIPWFDREMRFHPRPHVAGPWTSYLLGLAFAFGWTPCIGPVLGSILTLSAANATVGTGAILLTVYSLGLGVPFILAALFMQRFIAGMPTLRWAGRYLRVLAGVIMIVMGIAMMTGQLTRFAIWLLITFPALGQIG
ncbi:cytochrome c biogenesis CcdA family protein [Pararhizobium haloflavum]|jgi:cytochrome c-type biogenesis protein|uniref:cytochrome c biogenesis CcdA family protein n=1 Tax=Pararhizobium haloflavum TaxID=2037914 RepID=UPI0018E429DC|nr:cytochrome c biogenesis protein CcdA [Pararhizobium haloflavum]